MPQSSSGNTSPPKANAFAKPALPEYLWQAGAAARAGANALTFGGFDAAAAGAKALARAQGLSDLGREFGQDLAAEKAKDAYDAAHRPIAHAVGEIGGTALGLAAGGPVEGLLAGAAGLARAQRLARALALARAARTDARMAEATKATGREVGSLLARGGLMGVGNQAASDAITGHRSSIGDYAGAGLGGVAGAAAAPFTGAGRASAIDGAATSVAQDLLNGRPVDLDSATRTAWAGGLVGATGGLATRGRVSLLSRDAKGRLGERLGAMRSEMAGEPREAGPKKQEFHPLNGRMWGTFPDGRSGDLRMEDKFGPKAKLSKGQIAAMIDLGDKYRVYHFLPRDYAKALAVPAGDLAARLTAPNGNAFAPAPARTPTRPAAR